MPFFGWWLCSSHVGTCRHPSWGALSGTRNHKFRVAEPHSAPGEGVQAVGHYCRAEAFSKSIVAEREEPPRCFQDLLSIDTPLFYPESLGPFLLTAQKNPGAVHNPCLHLEPMITEQVSEQQLRVVEKVVPQFFLPQGYALHSLSPLSHPPSTFF